MWLAWEVLTRSFAAYLAPIDPETALRLRTTEEDALLRLADQAIAAALARAEASGAGAAASPQARGDRMGLWASFARKALQSSDANGGEESAASRGPTDIIDASTRTKVEAWARRALAADPLSARALRVLGQVADDDSAAKLMSAAAGRSSRESIATYWAMLASAKARDHAQAIHHADVLLRTVPNSMPLVIPTLVSAAESDASGALTKALGANPPWRSWALAELERSVSDPRTPLQLLLALKSSENPPTTDDLRHYLHFLIDRKKFDLAYYTWLQFLPPEQLGKAGFLFNGNFELPASRLPFDWTFEGGSGVTIDIAGTPDVDGQHALFLEFGDGRVEFRGVAQLLMLPAGSYRLAGKYRGSIQGRRGLVWRVRCIDAEPPLGTSSMVLGTAFKWTQFELDFTVPEDGCAAQSLRLELDARSPSERLVSGSIWYDDMSIVRPEKQSSDAATSGTDRGEPPR